MRVAISQPRYLPALNYLQRIACSDRFILLDDVQHQRRAFEHRNRLRTRQGSRWLSIPVDRAHGSRPPIDALTIKDIAWVDEHRKFVIASYRKAAHFDAGLVDLLYDNLKDYDRLVDVIEVQLHRTMAWLGLPAAAKIVRSSDLSIAERGSGQLARLTETVGGDTYISGPNGRSYIDGQHFAAIRVVYHDFEFPRYQQHEAGFVPWLAWLDYAFNMGRDATRDVVAGTPRLNAA